MVLRFYSLSFFHLLDYCQNVLFLLSYARNFKVKLLSSIQISDLKQLECSYGTVISKILHRFLDKTFTKKNTAYCG